MEWETEMETNFDELLEIICPPVQNNEVYDFILDGRLQFLIMKSHFYDISLN